MTIDSKDLMDLIQTLCKHVGNKKAVEILRDLNIEVADYLDASILTKNDEINQIFIDLCNIDTKELLECAADDPIVFNYIDQDILLDEIRKDTSLVKYLDKYYCIAGWTNCHDFIYDHNGDLFSFEKVKLRAAVINLNDTYISSNCPLDKEFFNEIIISIIKDSFSRPNGFDHIYVANNCKEDYVYESCNSDWNCFGNLQDLNLLAQVKKYEDELKEECNMTLEEFKTVRRVTTKELAQFLIDNTDIIEQLTDSWF